MKRIFKVLTLVALTAAMMALTAVPAFAQGFSCTNTTAGPPNNGLQFDNVNACDLSGSGIAIPLSYGAFWAFFG